jgi:hypothetical protein
MVSYLLDLLSKALNKLSRMSSVSPYWPSSPGSGSETERELNSPSSSSCHHPSAQSLSSVSLSHDSRHISALTSASVSSESLNLSQSKQTRQASIRRSIPALPDRTESARRISEVMLALALQGLLESEVVGVGGYGTLMQLIGVLPLCSYMAQS